MPNNRLCVSKCSKNGGGNHVREVKKISDYVLAFVAYFYGCDESRRHSLFEFSHRRVQAQYFHDLSTKTAALTEMPRAFGLSRLDTALTCVGLMAVHKLPMEAASASVFLLTWRSNAACLRGSRVSLAPQSASSLSISQSCSCQLLYLKPGAAARSARTRPLESGGPHLICRPVLQEHMSFRSSRWLKETAQMM